MKQREKGKRGDERKKSKFCLKEFSLTLKLGQRIPKIVYQERRKAPAFRYGDIRRIQISE